MRIFIAIPAALAALVFAGCGGSSSAAANSTAANSSAAASSSASATTPATTATPPATTPTTAVASSASATTTDATAPADSGPPPCRAAGLVLSFLGQQGATGHGELGFALRSSGSSSCNTIGYPGVQFLDRSGNPLPTDPTHATDDLFGASPLRTVVLSPGQTASFRLVVTHAIGGSSAGCTTAYALQVIPPNDTATLRVSIPDGAAECATTTVSPVRVGDSAYP